MYSPNGANPKLAGGLRTKGLFTARAEMRTPLVSVITVVRNGERHLENTIQSVLQQTYGNIEYIIVDGGSTDGTLEIIRKHDDQVAYWISEPDSGIYDAMNKGIEMSTGNIIGIINSDDWYEPDSVQAAVDCFARDPEIGLVHGDVRVWRQDGGIETIIAPRLDKYSLYVSSPLNHASCFVSRDVYSRYGTFNAKYQIVGDYELILRLHKHRVKSFYLPRIVANVRMGGVSNRPGSIAKVLRESYDAKRSLGYNRWASVAGYSYVMIKTTVFQMLRRCHLSAAIAFYRKHLSRHHRMSPKRGE